MVLASAAITVRPVAAVTGSLEPLVSLMRPVPGRLMTRSPSPAPYARVESGADLGRLAAPGAGGRAVHHHDQRVGLGVGAGLHRGVHLTVERLDVEVVVA